MSHRMPFPIECSKWLLLVSDQTQGGVSISNESLGDSGVGKTSFIQRFCTDNFKDTFSATIGVDLQVKMLNIDSRVVALQLWDTVRRSFLLLISLALLPLSFRPVKNGLFVVDRFFPFDALPSLSFRSITKQYFRKSDGVILVYDVTSEITFRNVRAWMTSVRVSSSRWFLRLSRHRRRSVGSSWRWLCRCPGGKQNGSVRRRWKTTREIQRRSEAGRCKNSLCQARKHSLSRLWIGVRMFILRKQRSIGHICGRNHGSYRSVRTAFSLSLSRISDGREREISIFRLMQEKDDKQRKGENIVDIGTKKKKRGCC